MHAYLENSANKLDLHKHIRLATYVTKAFEVSDEQATIPS